MTQITFTVGYANTFSLNLPPEYVEGIVEQVDSLENCEGCSETLCGDNPLYLDIDEMGTENEVILVELDWRNTEYSFTVHPEENTYGYPQNYTVVSNHGDHENLCISCGDDMETCDYCSDVFPSDETVYCDDCNYRYCDQWQCEENHNDDCTPESDGDYSIPSAGSAVSGPTIRSIRAFGVEFEQEGGNVRGVLSTSIARNYIAGNHGEHCGHEFVTRPMRGFDGENAIHEISALLRNQGFAPNDNCGTHFHVDLSGENDETVWQAIAAVGILEPLTFALSRGRERSQWCHPFSQEYTVTFAEMISRALRGSRFHSPQQSRYAATNSHAFSKHGTVEIRIMDGDAQVDTARLVNAISLVTGVVDFVAAIVAEGRTIRKYDGKPLALAFDAARAGFVPGKVLAFVEAQFADVHARRIREQKAEAMRQAAYAVYRQASNDLSFAENEIIGDVIRRTPEYTTYRNAQTTIAAISAEMRDLQNALNALENRRYAVTRVRDDADWAMRQSARMTISADRAAQTAEILDTYNAALAEISALMQ